MSSGGFSVEDHQRMTEGAGTMIHDAITADPNMMSEERFETTLHESVKHMLVLQVGHMYDRDVEADVDQIVREGFALVYDTLVPKRSFRTTFLLGNPDIQAMDERLTILRNKPQPDQRTPAWYERRHNLITASNAYLALGTEAGQNRLIYEKCQPIDQEKFAKVNTESPMHKGQKYEPVSVELYEERYNTKIEDFGCITHDDYGFLGASPDGINCDPKSKRYGRMLEIKNISNREIKGIPKKEYWIQMQLQMETCRLPECDFLETRFIEYESHDQFVADGTFTHTNDGKRKGIILCFSRDDRPIYEYAPVGASEDEYGAWESTVMQAREHDSWIRHTYWYLDEFSCVLVLRNEVWFASAIARMEQLWTTVLRERKEGYAHRAPRRRTKHESYAPGLDNLAAAAVCLISSDGL